MPAGKLLSLRFKNISSDIPLVKKSIDLNKTLQILAKKLSENFIKQEEIKQLLQSQKSFAQLDSCYFSRNKREKVYNPPPKISGSRHSMKLKFPPKISPW